MSRPITDKRGKVVHYSNGKGNPLCRPHTKVTFIVVTGIGRDQTVCEKCAKRDLRARYNTAVAAENEA